MAAGVTTALIAIAGVVLGWITIEIACKPCLEKGRDAIDRSLDPNYDPDDEDVAVAPRAPLLTSKDADNDDAVSSAPAKAI
ncbi:hypothetical protein MLD38_037168 [Melastoma candidum]|uniref:Uncharacterized protein n=1 Tax=Melastoma candidum TaxID=119954 RepID=A0ACB9LM73_9MYRT|nr:hypothetical protein MLD38_037168 [Melastoma candidum]